MSDLSTHHPVIPQQQQAIRDKCFHPTGTFIEFKKEEIEQSIPDRFEAQVRRNPDHLALKARDHAMTYDELNRAANRVAHAILAQTGEGPEPIALLFEQGVQAIVAMLGVAKAGKFFVLVDSSMPQDRVSHILKDSQTPLVVTNRRNVEIGFNTSSDGTQLLIVDDIDDSLPGENLGLPITPDNIVYLAYTSGSTGQPKGVIQTHRNLLYHTMTRTNSYRVCPEDRWTLLSFGTGQMIMNMCNALLNGAGLYPINVKEEGVAPLASWLIREEITMYHSSVMLFRHFVDSLIGGEEFPNLRLIKVASQTVISADVELYKKYFPSSCVLISGLSSTETGEIAAYFMDKKTRITTNTVPVGYANQDTEVRLLDDDGQKVGINGIGEIWVRSRYLSPGYWRRPDLTQAAFLPDPDGGDRRIYLTGDLGRMTPDGCLEHLGRKDFQVKIRGYRVEVAEIEIALQDTDGIKEAVVMSREDRPGNPRLVAYIVPARRPAPTVSQLRSSLAAKLPDYMVPSAFVNLDALPVLPNGRLDRLARPAPAGARPELETPFVAPRTPVEESLAEVWAGVLGLEEVGIHDNFLELGGDSLLASQVISRVISAFRVELPLRTLFEAPTVADMAVAITQSQAEGAKPEDIERLLAELEALSVGEAKQVLAGETKSSN